MRLFRAFRLLCLLAVCLVPAVEAGAGNYLLYVGTYTGGGSEGIYSCRFDAANGEMSSPRLAAATANPSFLAIDPTGRFLYAVNELDTYRGEPAGAVSVFMIEQESGHLTLRQQVSSLGAGPAHVSLDRSARYLLVANYNGGSVAVLPIGEDGRLGPRSALVQHAGSGVNPQRQAGPHPHSMQVTGDNRFVLAADLGLDKVFVYRFDADTGGLAPGSPGFVDVDPGAGPRHLAMAPSGRFVYGLNEMASTVTVFAFDPGPGTLRGVQTIPTLPGGFSGKNTAAEIVVAASGRFLYVSNRGHDSIAVFSIDQESGTLTSLEWVPSGGRTPRNFVIDPTGRWLLAANQDSNGITLFRIDQGSGRLTSTGRSLRVGSPVCLRFVACN